MAMQTDRPVLAMTIDEYVRECAGLGMVVRLYRWRCAQCREEAAIAQAFPAAITGQIAALRQIDRIVLGSHETPRHCGKPMEALDPVTRSGLAL